MSYVDRAGTHILPQADVPVIRTVSVPSAPSAVLWNTSQHLVVQEKTASALHARVTLNAWNQRHTVLTLLNGGS